MAKMIFSGSFNEELSHVTSEKVATRLRKALRSIEMFPEIGSPNTPESIQKLYGPHVRKSVVAPFDIVYEYDEDTDTVNVLDLIHFRQAK